MVTPLQEVKCVLWFSMYVGVGQDSSGACTATYRICCALWFSKSRQSKQTPWPETASELYRPGDRRMSAELVPNFAYKGCHVVRVTDPYWRNLDFLHWSRNYFFQVAPQLYSRGWKDPVPDPLLRKSGSAGNLTRTSVSVARNSDH
jgi:hypothetical protein